MLCDICNKNQATVHLTEIIDDQMNELHLCEECARQKSAQMESQFGLSDLLAGMVEFGKPATKESSQEAVSLKCPACALSYADFKKIGRLGCSECYFAFKKFLAPLLKRIHGSGMHMGKSVSKAAKLPKKKMELQDLRRQLQKAIESEAFEEAAGIRDKIKQLENQQDDVK